MTPTAAWDAIVLAGGSARRMGGADKVMLDVGGVPVLQRVVRAAAAARRIIVVGPQRPLAGDVVWCREDPPGGGPAAAVAAALHHVDAPVTVVLAGDLPFIDAPALEALVAVVHGKVGAVVVDAQGEAQWLCSVWPTASLHAAGLAAGASLRQTLGVLPWTPVTLDGSRSLDCDTPADVERARELAP